jgi:membrane-associated phospholipid phosphatase
MDNLLQIFGENGPIFLYILSLYLLWKKHTLYTFYNIGFAINIIVNLILKGIFKQPRPSDNQKYFELAVKNGQRFIFKDGMYYDIFGMPSGHAQSALFSTSFIYLSLQNTQYLLFFIFISLITIVQRVYFNHHTVLQVMIGGFVGTFIAYILYYFSQQKLKGNIREKPDDNASN